MSKLWIVTKNEFYRYFISPLAYVYLICFLLLNGSFAIYFGHFLERGQADLLPMFSFQPWLYLLFIPGISMRLWSEEFRNKTILQIITLPVSVPALVWGKFLASWLFCALALFLTFPFWIIVNFLGSPDNSVIAAGYAGSFVLAGCMLAISQTMSALTKNQVIALVTAVIANLVFFLSGLEYILGLFRGFAPYAVIDMVASFSFLTHFDTLSRGLVEARDIVFFSSLIVLFNVTTVLIVSFKTSGTTPWLKSNRRSYYILVFIFLLCGFSGLNLIANNLLRRFQIDFSQEKLFTVTESTHDILQHLPEPVTAKLYYSPILGERNPEIRLMFDNLRLLLQRYAALSDGRFTYRIYDPQPLSDIEDRALNAGLQPLPVIENNTNAYFGLLLTDEAEHRQVIPFFPLERRELLEQDVTEALYLLNHRKKNLGIITSLPMFEDIIENVATPKWEIINQLQKHYNIISIDSTYQNLNNIDVLMIAHPRGLKPELLKAIQNYSFRGGKILAFLDIAAEAPRIFSPATEELKPSDLGDLPTAWGFKFHDNLVVADLGNSSTVDATADYKNNPDFTQDLIQFYIPSTGFNHDFKETALLKKMLLTSASVFTPLDGAQTYFIPLLQAGRDSELLPAKVVYNRIHPAEILRHFEKDANPKYIGARIISKNPSRPFELIVVGDSDLLYDNFWTVHRTVLENNYSIPVLDNANFVFNALDTLQGDSRLIGLRGKSALTRTFETIEQQRKQALREFKIREKDIFDSIERTKNELQEIWNKKDFEGRAQFSPDELALIAGIRKKIDSQRQQLFTIRNEMNLSVETLQNQIKFAVIYAVPLLLLLGLLSFNLRSGSRNANHSPLKTNQRFWFISAASILLLGLGIGAVWLNNRPAAADYEGRPLFPQLASDINSVTSVTLQGHDRKLEFYLENDLWKLRGHPGFMVYQDRLRSFLSALIEGTIYERKTADMNKLSLFGLTPVDVPGSPNVRVELARANGAPAAFFEVGRYDIDLGRGSKGAYIKFDRQFQVWLAAIDLIDVSLNPADWTYSTAWNLRLGRLAAANGNTNPDYLANLAKNLLNMPLLSYQTSLNTSELLLGLTLQIENNNTVTLEFLQSEHKYYLRYEFATPLNGQNLQNFSSYAKAGYYQISAESWEKLNHVVADK